MLKVIIAGSRSVIDAAAVDAAVAASGFDVTEVVSGGARGVDRLGAAWARARNISVRLFLPAWENGRGAGFVRNVRMAAYAEALIAVWDGASRGTQHMIDEARRRGLRVFVAGVKL